MLFQSSSHINLKDNNYCILLYQYIIVIDILAMLKYKMSNPLIILLNLAGSPVARRAAA